MRKVTRWSGKKTGDRGWFIPELYHHIFDDQLLCVLLERFTKINKVNQKTLKGEQKKLLSTEVLQPRASLTWQADQVQDERSWREEVQVATRVVGNLGQDLFESLGWREADSGGTYHMNQD